jgi:hypothetical protein
MLLQYATRSFPHRRAAGHLVKRELAIDPATRLPINETGREIRFYGFFFDGLVAHCISMMMPSMSPQWVRLWSGVSVNYTFPRD